MLWYIYKMYKSVEFHKRLKNLEKQRASSFFKHLS